MENSIIFVTKSSMPTIEEYIDEIRDIWDTHWLTNMGAKHKTLQKNLCNYLGVDNLELFTNGHMALELSLQALNLRGEVITTPFTFASTTHAIVRNGLEPVFCDIKPDDFTIDENLLESLITERTCAIMPVHVYGNVCNVEKIAEIASKHDLKVVYDAAHTFGVKYRGKSLANFGDVSCYSFHATKVFNTIEGGAACFKDTEVGERLYNLKNFGIRGPERVDGVGANAKMNEFCAAMGLCNLRHIDNEIDKRKGIALHYRELLTNVSGLRLNVIQENVDSNYAYFPIVIDEDEFGVNRDVIFDKLAQHGIGARKYFYPLTNTFECFNNRYDVSKTPVAHRISNSILTLPLYADLRIQDVDKICEIIVGGRRR